MEEEKIAHVSAYIVGALAGAAIGVGAGILIGRALARRDCEERVNTEVAAIKSHYLAKANMARKGDNPLLGRATTMGTPRLGRPGTFASLAEEPRPSGTPVEPADDGEHDDEHDDGDHPEQPEFPGVKEPYIISVDEFSEDMVGEDMYTKLTVHYWVDDDGMTDHNEVPIPNMQEIVGNDFKYNFGNASGSEAIVYIRNERMLTDFEVVRNNGSFATHMGYGNPNEGR
jgi:hypothetical protein